MPPRSLLALALAATALGCASERPQRRPAHGAFPRDGYQATWQRAVRTLESQGYQLELRDEGRGILLTRERELQAPCGAESCLSRERVYLRLTERGQAIANIFREHWDPAARRWNASADPASVAAVERAERQLLAEAVSGEVVLRRSQAGEPCNGTEECQRGLTCEARRCRAGGG